jgi:hypothetical protein
VATTHDGRHADVDTDADADADAALVSIAASVLTTADTAGDEAGADIDEEAGSGDADDDDRHAVSTTQTTPTVAKPSRISPISTTTPSQSIPGARGVQFEQASTSLHG